MAMAAVTVVLAVERQLLALSTAVDEELVHPGEYIKP